MTSKKLESDESVQSIDISLVANHGFKDDPAAAVRGWTAEGPGQDVPGIRSGPLSAYGVTFELLDPAVNAGKAVLALRKADPAFVESASVAVGQKCDWLYLLNTGIWMEKGAPVGVLALVYEDGSRAEIEFLEGVHMAHWHFSRSNASRARRVTLEQVASTPEGHAHVYVMPVANPHPEKAVASLEFRAVTAQEHNPIWLILAVAIKRGECPMNPRKVDIAICPDKPTGRIRRLNGTNLGPPLLFEGIGMDITDDLKPLEIPLIRLHDAPWENGGLKLVDIPQVFPLFHADPADPRNYCFQQTDDYIGKCLATGGKILYRLGVSIEHTKRKYNTDPPSDYKKWAEICCGIIAHYNEGWADGLHHNIEYWEIWNEPDAGPAMWTGSWDDYIRLYLTTSKIIKARFPNIKVGGPAITSPTAHEKIEAFLAACRKEKAPLDFFSWHQYSTDPKDVVKKVSGVKKHLQDYGFDKTELHLNEWHYAGTFGNLFQTRGEDRRQAELGANNADGAAFTCDVLTGLQDSPVDMANYYTGTVLVGFGIYDAYAGRNKSYYALSAFAQIARFAERVEASVSSPHAVSALAGRKPDGSTAALISCFRSEVKEIVVDFGATSFKTVRVVVLDETRNLEPIEYRREGSRLILKKDGPSSVFFVELE